MWSMGWWSFDLSIKWPYGEGLGDLGEEQHWHYGGLHDKLGTVGMQGICAWTGWDASDFSDYKGMIWYVYMIDNGSLDAEEAPIRIIPEGAADESGTEWATWTGPAVILKPDTWTKIVFDFDRVLQETTKGANPDIIDVWDSWTSFDMEQTQEIGWMIEGGYNTYGNTTIYMDYVVAMDKFAPVSPSGISVTDPGTGGKLNVAWLASGEVDIERYNVYQSTVNNPATAKFVGSTYTNFYEAQVYNGTVHYFWVSGVDLSENEGKLSSESASAAASGVMPTVTFPYKGATLLSTNAGEFLNASVHTTLTQMKEDGITIIALPVTWFMPTWNSETMAPDGARTITDADLNHIIRDITNMQMKVMLQPELKVLDKSTNIWKIRPNSRINWFDNYNTFITQYASLAAQYAGVEIFSIGSELHSMATNIFDVPGYNDTRWTEIAGNVRGIFTNKLTFCARWGVNKRIPTEFDKHTYRNLVVWDDVDFIGINAFYPLSYDLSPPMGELYYRWANFIVTNRGEPGSHPYVNDLWTAHDIRWVRLNFEWFKNLEEWQADNFPSKDVIFTKVGYASMDYATHFPWVQDYPAMPNNPTLQRDAYEAMFRRVWDKDWMEGTFCYYYEPADSGSGNNRYTPQSKPAENVIDMWYSIRPHHFAIFHDGAAESEIWEPIVIEVHQADHSLTPLFNGTITLNVDKGLPGAISWTNLSGCSGILDDWGAGSAGATFTFDEDCGGIVTLAIKDNAMETVNIRISGPDFLKEGVDEDDNLIFTGPLSHFNVWHDGWGVIDVPETIIVQAIDVYNNAKVNFEGIVSLYVLGESSPGDISWQVVRTNGTFVDGGAGVDWAKCEFRLSESGLMIFTIVDVTKETVDVEASTVDGNYNDDDAFDPLIFVDIHHFAVYHDGEGLLNFSEKMAIRAEDVLNQPVFGYTGLITISIDTNNVTAPAGTIGIAKKSGAGILTSLGNYRWTYQMMFSDNATVTLSIIDNMMDTIDVEVTDGANVDNDRTPQYMIFAGHKYHYVKKNNAINAQKPYETALKAATSITDAIKVASYGDIILIIDNETYPGLKYDFFDVNNMLNGFTFAGHPTNSPTIDGTPDPAIDFNNQEDLVFDNIIFKGTGTVPIVFFSSPSPNSHIFRNCKFIGDGAVGAFDSDAASINVQVIFITVSNCGSAENQ